MSEVVNAIILDGTYKQIAAECQWKNWLHSWQMKKKKVNFMQGTKNLIL